MDNKWFFFILLLDDGVNVATSNIIRHGCFVVHIYFLVKIEVNTRYVEIEKSGIIKLLLSYSRAITKVLGYFTQKEVLSLSLKQFKESVPSFMSVGSLFHADGPDEKNPRGPIVFVRVGGTSRSPMAAERRWDLPGCMEYSGTIKLRTKQLKPDNYISFPVLAMCLVSTPACEAKDPASNPSNTIEFQTYGAFWEWNCG